MKKTVLSVLAIVTLIACLSVTLFACVPSNVEKAKEKMSDADYLVTSIEVEKEDSESGMTDVFVAIKSETLLSYEYILVFFFDTSAHAKAYAKDAKENSDDYLPGVVTKTLLENGEVGVSGKCVYFGSEEAVKTFKK